MIYLVGKWNKEPEPWSVEGVYDSHQDAVKACKDGWFVMPIEKNTQLDDKIVGFYPEVN